MMVGNKFNETTLYLSLLLIKCHYYENGLLMCTIANLYKLVEYK